MINALPAHSTPRRYAQLPRFFRWFSDHCVMRQIDAGDVERIWKPAAHPAYARCWTVAAPGTEAEVVDLVQRAQADWARGERYVMAATRKNTQEFVGCIELRAAQAKGVWLLDWFIHPSFIADRVAMDAITATADLMFSALEVERLYANCPARHAPFEQLLNEAGFIELVPAGSLDHASGRPRPLALYELGRSDWIAVRRAQSTRPSAAPVGMTSAPNTAVRHELALL